MNIYKKLEKYDELDLLNYIKNLNDIDKIELINNLKKVDFKLMNNLYKNSYIDEKIELDKISPLKCIFNHENETDDIGENIIKNNNYGIVIMAGGNASRLGMNIPKGTLKINFNGNEMSLFEIYINKIKEVYNKYGVYINIYIMTSDSNFNDTKSFFEINNYFSYPKEKIKFFIQENLPFLNTFGKLILKEKTNIWIGPNGNGNVFSSLKKTNLIYDMKKNNIKYCLFIGIDNPLVKLVDLKFISTTISNNYKLASKTIYKDDENNKEWVFCKYKNKPFMIDNNHILYFTNKIDDNNNYIYRDTNMMYHLIHIDLIEKFSNIKLRYHRSFKKYDYLNYDGMKVSVTKPNAFKFEQFIYDAFYYTNDMLLYRVSRDEFCPIKNREDILKVENILNK